jgi:predicted nucleic acid-binding protein
VIVDTSAWVEFLRATGSTAHRRLRSEIEAGGDDLRVSELTVMEVLVGARDELDARRLRTLLHSFEVIPLAPLVDTEAAAYLQRRCRDAGYTIRNMVDCLIAAAAARLDEPVLHLDRDFDVLRDVVGLRVVQ